MPKVSKVSIPNSEKSNSTRVGRPKLEPPTLDKYQCTMCGSTHKKLRGNFPASHSMIYGGNGGFLPICNKCLENLYDHYNERLGDEGAIRRLCMKFDIYWSPEVYALVTKANTSSSRIKQYISRTNLFKYARKTYDDTIDEAGYLHPVSVTVTDDNGKESSGEDGGSNVVTADMLKFWGAGFAPELYHELESRYDRWTKDVPKPVDSGAEALYRQICILEVTITRNAISGKPIESAVNTLNTLIGSVNAKPVQKKMEESADVGFDSSPFGVGIKMLENTRPVPKPLPDLEDADKVAKYLSTWVVGHLCKLFNIKNANTRLYEAEIEKYRIDRPELEELDDEDIFAEMFGSDGE